MEEMNSGADFRGSGPGEAFCIGRASVVPWKSGSQTQLCLRNPLLNIQIPGPYSS